MRLLLLLSVLMSLLRLWNVAEHSRGRDFYQFWAAGQMLRNHQGDVYSEQARQQIGAVFQGRVSGSPGASRYRSVAELRKNLETYSTPFLYTVYGVMASGDYETDYQRYVLVCLAAAVGAPLVLSHLLGYTMSASLAAATLLLGWFEPIELDIRVGNVNEIQLGLIALLLWVLARERWRARNVIAGFVLGCTILFKPNTALVAATLSFSWFANHRLQKLVQAWIGVLLGAVTAVALSSTLAGSISCWTKWLSALRELPPEIVTLDLGNYSLSKLLEESLGFKVRVAFVVTVALSSVFFIWLARRPSLLQADSCRQISEDSLMVGLGCVIYLLCAGLVWTHYLVMALPLVLTVLRPEPLGIQTGDRSLLFPMLGSLAVLLLAIGPAAILLQSDEPQRLAAFASFGLLLLFALAMAELWSMHRVTLTE